MPPPFFAGTGRNCIGKRGDIMRRLLTVMIAIMGLALGTFAVQVVVAQDATPAGEVIDPAQCQVEPRAIEDIEQLINASAAGAEATPDAAEAGTMEGEAADEATVEAVTATYRELVACLNAGEYLRVYALYTDDYVQRNFAESGQTLEQLQATPSPDQQEATALVGVSDVRQIEGDRVAARVETASQAAEGTIVIDAILVQQDDRYVIDDETVVEAPQQGTPESAAGEEQAASSGDAAAEGVEVVSMDILFEPEEVTIPADTDVTVTLPNEGVTLHNFSIDELGIDIDIQPGATEETVINAPAGEYEYYCNVPGHKAAGMLGTLTVG
jgi:plastocyanin